MNQNLFKELASLVPAQLDAGQVFTGTPTGKSRENPLSDCILLRYKTIETLDCVPE